MLLKQQRIAGVEKRWNKFSTIQNKNRNKQTKTHTHNTHTYISRSKPNSMKMNWNASNLTTFHSFFSFVFFIRALFSILLAHRYIDAMHTMSNSFQYA